MLLNGNQYLNLEFSFFTRVNICARVNIKCFHFGYDMIFIIVFFFYHPIYQYVHIFFILC